MTRFNKPLINADHAMTLISKRILFDTKDHALLSMVNDVRTPKKAQDYLKRFYYPYFHPRGIKELSESKGLRIAFSVMHLLDSLEGGQINDRLTALRSLKNEILSASESILRKNTARVLLQIMKEIVRTRGDHVRQFELAHDFRTATSGKPRIIRRLLKNYHLLEMPEEWSQISFDDHVHDANTKGRKSSTHLIMDAWIKGIRRLRVVYSNYIQPQFAAELLQAAEIMDITVRIGIEFSTRFRDQYVQFTWVPRGFTDSQGFLCFLADPAVIALMEKGRQVARYQQANVIHMLQIFNEKYRDQLNQHFNVNMELLDEKDFMAFVKTGQPAMIHLAEFIHNQLVKAFRDKLPELRKKYIETESEEEKNTIIDLVHKMNKIDQDTILLEYLNLSKQATIDKHDNSYVIPEMLNLSPQELIGHLIQLPSGYRITLNLRHLKAEDVLEILYDCEGTITRLEIFNLKDYALFNTSHITELIELQSAINSGNVIKLKLVIRKIMTKLSYSDDPKSINQLKKIKNILNNIYSLREYYNGAFIKARIGSDSTGRSSRLYGMGFVILDTLPMRVQKQIKHSKLLEKIPVSITPLLRHTYFQIKHPDYWINTMYRYMRRIPVIKNLGYHCYKDWVADDIPIIEREGNIVILGGKNKSFSNQLMLEPKEKIERIILSWRYLNTGLKNSFKVIFGFIPAFLTFYLTNDWWVLAYFGAVIWFGITGIRNIIQSVLGGGGFKRSPLLRWNDYVSWERLTDSLLFTGFSVPLLDFIVKTMFLDRFLGITTANNPIILYSIIALANGLYLSSHNAFRGLPKGAIYGNFFRSIFSIPIAILFNSFLYGLFTIIGVHHLDALMQKLAAIISKGASDCVAGIIEGAADRFHNIRNRLQDYEDKLSQLFNAYSHLELLFPNITPLEILDNPEQVNQTLNEEAKDYAKIIIVTVLDLLYFWMYQPRARSAIKQIVKKLSDDEKRIFFGCQFILLRQRDISQLFIDGFMGKNFSKPLAFYLDRSDEYLQAIKQMAE